jgi:hypothetical protein
MCQLVSLVRVIWGEGSQELECWKLWCFEHALVETGNCTRTRAECEEGFRYNLIDS